jgi:hypothetical protein
MYTGPFKCELVADDAHPFKIYDSRGSHMASCRVMEPAQFIVDLMNCGEVFTTDSKIPSREECEKLLEGLQNMLDTIRRIKDKALSTTVTKI